MTCCAPVSAFPTALAAYRMPPAACACRRQPAGHARQLANHGRRLSHAGRQAAARGGNLPPLENTVRPGRQLAAPGKHHSHGGGSLPPLENIVRAKAAACRPWKTPFARGRRLAARGGKLPPPGEGFLFVV